MKKWIVIVFISLFTVALAKNPITVKYNESSDNPEIRGILGALDAYQVTSTLYADSLDAKYYSLWMVICKGEETQRRLMGYYPIQTDSTVIMLTAVPKDSTNVVIYADRINGAPRHQVNIPTAGRLLIGCDYSWEFGENDTIPLIGYSSGIHSKINLGNGIVADRFDICGLRFSKERPLLWREKYGLSDYLYFEVIPVKNMKFY
ncbi:MAG: hypothetical protein K2J10_09315 [Muribaculaceae bacterium]|nr:hypothetical protein [Muribaculaceae bacterium]